MDSKLVKEQQDYRELYLKERMSSEQHRSNYDLLKTIVASIQINREIAENRMEHVTQDDLVKQYISENTPAEFRENISQSRIAKNYEGRGLPPEYDKNRSTNKAKESSVKKDSEKRKNEMDAEKNSQRRREPPMQRTNGQINILRDVTLRKPSLNKKVTDSLSTDKTLLRESDVSVSFWKSQYAALRDQYKAYKAFADTELTNMALQSNKEANAENNTIRAELELANSSLNATNASLIRNKIVLQRENATLREELDETRLKLQEQTVLYQSLTTKMDNAVIQSTSLPEELLLDQCCKPSHSQLMSQITAAESKAVFYKTEMEKVLANNNKLIADIETMKINHKQEEREMKGLITYIYNECTSETISLFNKLQDVCIVMNTQQMYAEELASFTRGQNNENLRKVEELSKEVEVKETDEWENEAKKLNAIISEKTNLEDQLSELVSLLEYYKQESGKQKEFSDKFLDKFYEIIGGDVEIVESSEEINDTSETSQCNKERTSERLREEKKLKRVIRRLMLWKKENQNKSKRYEERIKELEQLLTCENLKYSDLSEKLSKKSKVIGCLMKNTKKISKKARNARKMEIRKMLYPRTTSDLTALTTFSEGLIMPSFEMAAVPETQPADPNINFIHEKHSEFENVLKSVATSTSSELDVTETM